MAGQKKLAVDLLARPEEVAALDGTGLFRLPMDIPFTMDAVNVVLVEGDGLALIDAGLRQPGNSERLEDFIQKKGYQLSDVREIYLTHPHLDHFGLAGEWAEKTGADVFCWKPSIERFEAYQEFWPTDRAAFVSFLRASGVEEGVAESFRKVPSQFSQIAGPVRITQGFDEGEALLLAGRHRVRPFHVPGHSPWCTAFWFEETSILVSGDALLPKATSNPLWYPPATLPAAWQGLPVFRRSLQRLSDLPARWVIPGHGETFPEHSQAINRALEHQARRKARIAALFHNQNNPVMTLWEVTTSIFDPDLVKQSPYLVLSDISRQIDWLLFEGQIQQIDDAPIRYRLAGK